MEVGLHQGLQQEQARIGVVLLSLGAILAFFGAVGLLLYFKPGGSSPDVDIFVAGPVDEFAPGTITYFEREHLYVVRLHGGSLVALYDLDPRMQMLLNESGDASWLTCRVLVEEDAGGNLTSLGSPPQGFEEKVLREPCHGSVWDAEGSRLFGPSRGDLDRFPIAVVDDKVHIYVGSRRCVNPIGPEAPCLPTQ